MTYVAVLNLRGLLGAWVFRLKSFCAWAEKASLAGVGLSGEGACGGHQFGEGGDEKLVFLRACTAGLGMRWEGRSHSAWSPGIDSRPTFVSIARRVARKKPCLV